MGNLLKKQCGLMNGGSNSSCGSNSSSAGQYGGYMYSRKASLASRKRLHDRLTTKTRRKKRGRKKKHKKHKKRTAKHHRRRRGRGSHKRGKSRR